MTKAIINGKEYTIKNILKPYIIQVVGKKGCVYNLIQNINNKNLWFLNSSTKNIVVNTLEIL